MAYDEDLADRVRELSAGAAEKKMFGGLAFLVGGHMAVAVSGQGGLMVRVEPSQLEALLAETGVEPFQMRGREMTGWLRVSPDALDSDDALGRWVDRGVSYARSLLPK